MPGFAKRTECFGFRRRRKPGGASALEAIGSEPWEAVFYSRPQTASLLYGKHTAEGGFTPSAFRCFLNGGRMRVQGGCAKRLHRTGPGKRTVRAGGSIGCRSFGKGEFRTGKPACILPGHTKAENAVPQCCRRAEWGFCCGRPGGRSRISQGGRRLLSACLSVAVIGSALKIGEIRRSAVRYSRERGEAADFLCLPAAGGGRNGSVTKIGEMPSSAARYSPTRQSLLSKSRAVRRLRKRNLEKRGQGHVHDPCGSFYGKRRHIRA